jgi:hypothetical protein
MKTEQDLQQRLANLPDSIEPTRDLWPELAARLAQTPQQPVLKTPAEHAKTQAGWWLAVAAAAVLFTLWSPWSQYGEQPLLAQHEQQQGRLSEPEFTGSAAQSVHPAGFNNHQARRLASSETQWRLSSEFEQQRALQLAKINQVPEVYQDWKQQLQIWKQATNLVLLALQYQPDEPGLLKQLSKLQQQELAYLQKVVLADQS